MHQKCVNQRQNSQNGPKKRVLYANLLIRRSKKLVKPRVQSTFLSTLEWLGEWNYPKEPLTPGNYLEHKGCCSLRSINSRWGALDAVAPDDSWWLHLFTSFWWLYVSIFNLIFLMIASIHIFVFLLLLLDIYSITNQCFLYTCAAFNLKWITDHPQAKIPLLNKSKVPKGPMLVPFFRAAKVRCMPLC